MTPSIESQFPIRDGFVLRTDLRCEPTYLALAIEEYIALRRSRAMRSKFWMIPESTSFVVPAQDAYEYEVTCVPGAAIWGFVFVVISGNVDEPAGPFSFQVRESCTDVPLLSEVIRADNYKGGAVDGSIQGGGSQNLLSKLLVVPIPGLVTVEIANLGATDANVQLILCGGEPVCP